MNLNDPGLTLTLLVLVVLLAMWKSGRLARILGIAFGK